MKNLKFSFLFIFCGFLSASAWSNAKVIGNGGNVVVCENLQGQIIKAELLDLFEGKALYNFNYVEDPTPALVQVLKYTDKLSYAGSPVSAINLSADVQNIYANIHMLPSGVGLEPIADSEHFILPKGCRVVQTVNYRDWKKIYVDSDVWNFLSETQKAALLLHEAIYAYYREGNFEFQGEINSVRARYAVASLFSNRSVEAVDHLKDIAGNGYLHCLTEEFPISEFFMYKNSTNKFIAQFRYYFNRVALTRSWLESDDKKIFTGEIKSAFEPGVLMQLNFNTPTTGTIYLNGAGKGPSKFTCASNIKY